MKKDEWDDAQMAELDYRNIHKPENIQQKPKQMSLRWLVVLIVVIVAAELGYALWETFYK